MNGERASTGPNSMTRGCVGPGTPPHVRRAYFNDRTRLRRAGRLHGYISACTESTLQPLNRFISFFLNFLAEFRARTR